MRESNLLRYAMVRLCVLGIPLFGIYVGLQMTIGAYGRALPPSIRVGAFIFAYIASALVMIVLYRWFIRLTEQRSAIELTLTPRKVLSGFIIGAVLLCITQSVAMIAGASRIVDFSGIMPGVPLFFGAAFAAIGEEIIFRGIVFRLLDEAGGTFMGVAGSALLFGGLHAVNPGATLVGIVAIAIEAGVLLSLAYKVSGTLWLPIGIHLGWNFFEGGVFGSAVSGTSGGGMVAVMTAGPEVITGGNFGLEASIQAVVVCAIASFLFASRISARSHPVPRSSADMSNGNGPISKTD